MSFWKVPDRETVDLMESFCLAWQGGTSKAEALRQAQLQAISRLRQQPGSFAHPFYWAEFALIGDWR